MAEKTRGRGCPENLASVLAQEARLDRIEAMQGPDDVDGRALGRVVGSNLSYWREQKGLDLATLADICGIEEGLLRRLESGEVSPSLRAVWNLATALEVSFGALLQNGDPDAQEGRFRVHRADRGRTLVSSSGAFRSRVMFQEGDPRTPEVYEFTLAPGGVEDATAHAEGVYEHISVISGELVVRSGPHEVRLGRGDALLFEANERHGYENPGSEPAVAHLVMHFWK